MKLYCKNICKCGSIAKMDVSMASLQRWMSVWLHCKDGCQYGVVAKTSANVALFQGCVPMDASESIIARMNTTIQSMASCFKKKKQKTKKQKKKKTKQNKEEEESNKSNHRKDYEQK